MEPFIATLNTVLPGKNMEDTAATRLFSISKESLADPGKARCSINSLVIN